eukprot:g11128.t1
MTVWTFMPPKESFRSAEELKLVQEVLTLMPVGEELRIALKTKEGGQFSDKMEAPETRKRSPEQPPEQTLLLRTKEFAGTGAEAVTALMQTLFAFPRWDRHPDDLPPKAALVIGSPVKDKTAEMFRRFENGEEARALQEWKSKSESLPLYYDEHNIFFDRLSQAPNQNELIESSIVPEWRLFGNWLNDGEGSSELFHRGITKLLSRGREGVKDRQGPLQAKPQSCSCRPHQEAVYFLLSCPDV